MAPKVKRIKHLFIINGDENKRIKRNKSFPQFVTSSYGGEYSGHAE